MWVADDGTRFIDKDLCALYESFCRRCDDAMSTLGERPQLGHGEWYQHDRRDVATAKTRLVLLARDEWPNESVWQHKPEDIHPMGIAGRIASEGSNPRFSNAWGRLMCINFDNFREYDQPYFALNPDKAAA